MKHLLNKTLPIFLSITLILGSLFWVGVQKAYASVIVVQTAFGGSQTTLPTVSISPTAGNTLIVAYGEYNENSSCTSRNILATDNLSDTFTRDNRVPVFSSSYGVYQCVQIFRLTNIPSGITSVTLTGNGGSWNGGTVSVLEVSGLAASPVDAVDSVGAVCASNNWQTAAMTPTAGLNELIFGQSYNPGANVYAETLPYHMIGSEGSGASGSGAGGYQIVTSTSGSYTPSGVANSSGNYCMAAGITYKAAATPKAANLFHNVIFSKGFKFIFQKGFQFIFK